MASRTLSLAGALVCCLGLPAWAAQNAAVPASPAASLSTYRTYAIAQAELLARMTRILATDIEDGNVEAAQNDYAMTRKYLERIRPVLATQRDLVRRMDAAAEDFSGKELDPAFSGFHRIEHALFVRRSTQGLAATADRLHDDAQGLRQALATQPMAYDLLLEGPAAVVEAVSARAVTGGREPYSQTDLWDIEANVEGAKAMVDAIRPQVVARDPLLMPRLSAAFAATDERLAQLRDGCGFKAFDALTGAEKDGLRQTTAMLAHELAKLKVVPTID